MIKWLDKKNDNLNSILRILMEVVSKVFRIDKYENGSYVNIKTAGHNQRFLMLMDRLDIAYCIEKEAILLRVNKLDFLRKISKEYPMFFSAMIIKEGFVKEWEDLSIFDSEDDEKYNINMEVKRFLIKMLCPKDSVVIRYTIDDMQNIHDILYNIRFDVMAKIYYERNTIPSMDSMNDISDSKMSSYELEKYNDVMWKFIDAKSYIMRYIKFISKYKDEYPIVCEDIECLDFLLQVKKEEEMKILLDRLTEFYVIVYHGDCDDSECFHKIVKDDRIASFEAKKNLLMMDSWEYKFIYRKINKLIWINESLGVYCDKNIKEEITDALCNDNIDFVLDDILYSLVQSLCKEYIHLNLMRTCEFFDSIYLEEYDNNCDFIERKDVICNAISNKYEDIERKFKTDMTSISIMNTDNIYDMRSVYDISFKKFDKLSRDLKDIRVCSNLYFDYVSDFIIYNQSFKTARCVFAFNSISKSLFVDMRGKNRIGDFEKYLNKLIDNEVVDRIIVWINEESVKMSGFVYNQYNVSLIGELYEIYNRVS